MKKSLFLLPAFSLGLAFASCSNEDAVNGSGLEGNLETNYISINLVPAPDNGSRATTSSDYEYGTDDENAVTSIRFYFFDNQNKAASVKSDGTNYFDWTNDFGPTPGTEENVEETLKAVVVINTKEGDKGLPAKILAILNPESLGLLDTSTSMDLSDLRAVTYDKNYAAGANKSKSFVLNNSVYADNGEVVATVVPATAYAKTQDDAIKNPVNIYVERNVAKVRVSLDLDKANMVVDNDGRIALKYKDGDVYKDLKIGEQQIYLKLGNWDLTAETDLTKLFKSIDTSWDFGWTWNKPEYFRSFWAQNATGSEQSWHDFNSIGTNGKEIKKENVIYANENAPYHEVTNERPSIEDFTKVIIAGTLQDQQGNNVNITKYAGISSIATSDDADKGFEALKKSILGSLTQKIYSISGNSATEIGVNDVKFVTAKAAEKVDLPDGESNLGHYNVYLQLISKTGQWSKSNEQNAEATNTLTPDQVNEILAGYKAQIYKGGMTYYYFPIEHLGRKGNIGEYGVVRNHIYDCAISTISGLGTPVFDPEETIWPEKPVDDETYIAAKINILSWRLVHQKIDLNW